MLKRCFSVTLEVPMVRILPWAGTTPLFEAINPRQAQTVGSHRFMASPWVSPLCFPREDKEEEKEMNPGCFL